LLLIIRGAKIPFKEREFDAEEDGSLQEENLQTSNEKVPDVLTKNCMLSLTGEFVVRPGGQSKIYQHFKDLYINRMQLEGIKKPTKSVELQFVQSKPQISKKSQKMAEKAREKVLQQAGVPEGNVDIVTLLLSKDKIRNNNKREREELILSDKQFKDEAELTFKPQTNVRDVASEP